MTTLEEVRQNYREVGHLTEVRDSRGNRYHVAEDELQKFLDQNSDRTDLCADYRDLPDEDYEMAAEIDRLPDAFLKLWKKNRTSV